MNKLYSVYTESGQFKWCELITEIWIALIIKVVKFIMIHREKLFFKIPRQVPSSLV